MIRMKQLGTLGGYGGWVHTVLNRLYHFARTVKNRIFFEYDLNFLVHRLS